MKKIFEWIKAKLNIRSVGRSFAIKHSRLDESLRYDTWYKSMTGKCLNEIDTSKIYIDNNGIVKLRKGANVA